MEAGIYGALKSLLSSNILDSSVTSLYIRHLI